DVVERRMRNVTGRKALILFSDGEDTTSRRYSYDDAINSVTESEVLVYGLRYPSEGGGGGYGHGRGGRGGPWPRTQIPQIPLPFPWPFPRRPGWPFFLPNSLGNIDPMYATGSPVPTPRRNQGDFMADIAAAGGGPVYDAAQIGDLGRLAG